METADYCDYELSLALKVAGFDYPCYFYYTKENAPDDCVWQTTSEEAPVDYNRRIYAGCSMPLLYQAQKWLRERKDIAILLDCEFKDSWGYEIAKFDNQFGVPLCECKYGFQTYESALSAGIKSALILLAGKEGKG